MIANRHAAIHGDVSPVPQKHRFMFRPSDAIGLAGMAAFLCGAWIMLVGRHPPPLWITWTVGPTLCYLGGATTAIWLLWRLFGGRPWD